MALFDLRIQETKEVLSGLELYFGWLYFDIQMTDK